MQGEFPLLSVPVDTWVGRYVRFDTPKDSGQTGLIHKTGNGWVRVFTSLRERCGRSYDLVVVPAERAIMSETVPEKIVAGEGNIYGGKGASRGAKGEARYGRPARTNRQGAWYQVPCWSFFQPHCIPM